MTFELNKKSGRLILSAEDLLHQALTKKLCEVVAIFGVAGEQPHQNKKAHELLLESLHHRL